MIPVAILCGGLATRMHPITKDIPKSMIMIRGKPFIEWQLRLLEAQGAERVVLCLGHLGEQIEYHVKNGMNHHLEISFVRDGDELLGTAGAIRHALPVLGENFFVMYGDSYLPFDLQAMQNHFIVCAAEAMMATYKNENKLEKSNVRYYQGYIPRYDKDNPTPDMEHVDYGICGIRTDTFNSFGTAWESISCIYRMLSLQGRLSGYEASHRFYEIGSISGLKDFEEYMEEKKCS